MRRRISQVPQTRRDMREWLSRSMQASPWQSCISDGRFIHKLDSHSREVARNQHQQGGQKLCARSISKCLTFCNVSRLFCRNVRARKAIRYAPPEVESVTVAPNDWAISTAEKSAYSQFMSNVDFLYYDSVLDRACTQNTYWLTQKP